MSESIIEQSVSEARVLRKAAQKHARHAQYRLKGRAGMSEAERAVAASKAVTHLEQALEAAKAAHSALAESLSTEALAEIAAMSESPEQEAGEQ